MSLFDVAELLRSRHGENDATPNTPRSRTSAFRLVIRRPSSATLSR